MRQATGVYLMFLDSDDWLAGNAAETACLKAIEQTCDMVMYGHMSHHIHFRKKLFSKNVYHHCKITTLSSLGI
jgi:hypothetical protein